jgi:hypothetical protein
MSETVLAFQGKATAILAKLYTDEIVLTDPSHTRTNPWEDYSAANTDGTQTVKAGVMPPGTRRWNGELVEQQELYIIIAAEGLTITPDTEKTVTVNSKTYPIERVNGIPMGANPAAYEIFCKLY